VEIKPKKKKGGETLSGGKKETPGRRRRRKNANNKEKHLFEKGSDPGEEGRGNEAMRRRISPEAKGKKKTNPPGKGR